MKSQLKGGWMVKWNEIFNGLPTVIINEMEIWPCVSPSGRNQTEPLVRGPGKEEDFSEEQDPASYRRVVLRTSWSRAHWCVQEAAWWAFQVHESFIGRDGASHTMEPVEGVLAVARLWLPCLIGHLLLAHPRKLLFTTGLIHGSDLWSTSLSVLHSSFLCTLAANKTRIAHTYAGLSA